MNAILISDDSQVIEMAESSLRLRWPHNQPTVATTATNGLEAAEHDSPDVVLIHPSYTDMTLSETMRKLREISDIPVLVLSDQGDEMEAVSALELGADDYVRLPCELTEVMARVWALLRRASSFQRPEEERTLHSGNLLLNPVSCQVFLGDRQVALTSTEFQLLHLLMKNRGSVVTHHTIETSIWGADADSSCLAKKYVQRLRSKLSDGSQDHRWIMNVHGTGYRFVGPVEALGEIVISSN